MISANRTHNQMWKLTIKCEKKKTKNTKSMICTANTYKHFKWRKNMKQNPAKKLRSLHKDPNGWEKWNRSGNQLETFEKQPSTPNQTLSAKITTTTPFFERLETIRVRAGWEYHRRTPVEKLSEHREHHLDAPLTKWTPRSRSAKP